MLYARVDIYPKEANQLTKILVDLELTKLLRLINDPKQLKDKAAVLKEALSI